MERLRQVAFALALLCLAGSASKPLAGQDKCSLKVRVVSPAGQAVPATVAVRESDGRVTERDYKGRDLAFCDLGILPVTVTISLRPGCNKVTIEDVFVSLDRPYLLKVTFDPKDCMPETVPPPEPMCEVLLRVRDRDGNDVPNADIAILAPKAFRSSADRFGRVLVSGAPGVRSTGTVDAPGFDRKEFDFTCAGYDPQEEIIELQKQR
jgi:hypothetical protein